MSHISKEFPTISIDEIWHVGTLNPSDKQEDSHEGAGLSITNYPDEWCQITCLSGELHACSKPHALFLNFHSLSDEQTEQIYQWGCEMGYIEPATLYRVGWYHGDFEMDVYSDFLSREEALEEADGDEESLEEIQGYISLPVMQERVRGQAGPTLLFGLLTTLYVEEVLTELEGVWWEDDLEPSILSAPRGVIVPSKIQEWTFTKAE